MRTLLLADDNVTTQRVVALTFAEEAFRVLTVSDGQQAIESMAAMRPDIVLAGTALPRTNGYELAEYMRDSETLRSVPVLLLSGAFELVDAARIKASGAHGVIDKPLEPTAVISRVKALLGLKDARPVPPAGRLVTPASENPPTAVPTPPVSAWDHLPRLGADQHAVEGRTPGSGREDYRDTLDAAFDSLDQHLAGEHPERQAEQRNPSPPLGQSSGAPDPRSPGRSPAATSEGALPPRPDQGDPIFEVDAEWFAEDDKARETRRAQERKLAAEMGIHEVEVPNATPVPNAQAPSEDLDVDFGLDQPIPSPVAPTVPATMPVPTLAMSSPASGQAPAALVPPPPAASTAAPLTPFVPPAPASSSVADDFAALLAFEIGDVARYEEPAPPAAAVVAPVIVHAAAPEITDAMLDQIANRVVDRLSSGAFGTHLRDVMTATVRDAVRAIVADTSERLVRDEIARIRAKTQT